MKRIAIFVENLYGGGVQRILQIILRNFDYSKYDVTLYTNHQQTLLPEYYPTNIKQRCIFSSPSTGIISNIVCKITNKFKLWIYYHCTPSTFYSFFIRDSYDVGIAFIEGYATRYLSGAPRKMKKIAWLHTDIERNHWTDVAFKNREEEKLCYSKFDYVVCVSEVVKQKAKEIFGASNTIIIHNPIDVRYVLERSKFQVDINDVEHLRFISLGALIEVKGYDRLLEAARRLLSEGYVFELLILGDGPERICFEKYIDDKKMAKYVKLLGYVDNPYPYVKHSDVYVCSSRAEGFNTAVSEALILEKAVISTKVSGITEQLGCNNEYGIVVDNTVEGIYYGLKRMMDVKVVNHYKQMAARKSGMFNIDRQMNEIYDVIEG